MSSRLFALLWRARPPPPFIPVVLTTNYTYLLDELGYEEVSMASKSGGSCDPQRRLDPDDI